MASLGRRACITVAVLVLLAAAPAVALAHENNGNTTVRTDGNTIEVTAQSLEHNPSAYVGKRIRVDADVDRVLGPRLFTITDRNSADATGETMVVLPMPLAAMVREHDHVNVEGTLEPLAAADFSPQWGWLRIEPGVNATLARKPVLFTDRLIGEKDHQVLVDTSTVASRLVGSVESSEVKPLITTVDALASGTKRLVGGTVHLSNVTIDRSAGGKGFFITAGNTRVFVLPALMPPSAIAPGDTVSIDGVVLDMPRAMIDQSKVTANTNIYVYALGVRQ